MPTYKASEWERKGFRYYVKFLIVKRPAVALTIPFYCVIAPAFLTYSYFTAEAKLDYLRQFAVKYVVYRHDDPLVKTVFEVDDNGKKTYPYANKKINVD